MTTAGTIRAPSPWRCAWLIGLWRARVAARALLYRLLRTREGLLTLAVVLIATPGLAASVARGELGGAPVGSVGYRVGLWVLGVASGLSCLAFLVPSVLARSLVLDGAANPLRAQPATLRLGAGVTGAVVAWGASVYVLAFTMLFHGRLLLSVAASPLSVLAGVGVALGVMVVFGTSLVEVARAALHCADPRRRAAGLRRCCALPFFASFVGLAWMPGLVDVWLPGLAERLGTIVLSAAAPTPSSSRPLVLAALGAVAAIVSPIALQARWQSLPLEELGLTESGTVVRDARHRAARIPVVGTKGLSGQARLLIAKERSFTAPTARVAGVGTAALIGLALLTRGTDETLAVLAVSAILALPALSWMGREGRGLDLLALRLGVGRLYRVRVAAALSAVATDTAVAVGCLLLVTNALGAGIDPLSTGIAATLGSISFPVLAVSIGALFPDFERRSALLCGASRAGGALYVLVAGALVYLLGMGPDGVLGRSALPVVVASAGFVGRWAVGRQIVGWRP